MSVHTTVEDAVAIKLGRTDLRKGKAPHFCVTKIWVTMESGEKFRLHMHSKNPLHLEEE